MILFRYFTFSSNVSKWNEGRRKIRDPEYAERCAIKKIAIKIRFACTMDARSRCKSGVIVFPLNSFLEELIYAALT